MLNSDEAIEVRGACEHNLKHVERVDGNLVAVSRSGELAVADEFGRERERYKLPYGAVISVKEGDKVKVKVLAVDDRGKVRPSMKSVDQETGVPIEDGAVQGDAT